MRFALAVAGLTLLVSCTGTQGTSGPLAESGSSTLAPSVTPSVQPVTDVRSFVAALEEAGHTVRQGPLGNLPGFESFGTRGRMVSIEGVRVWAFEYPTTVAYDKVRSSISKDGHEVGNASIDWVPHIYGSGRLIVVLVGERPSTRRSLDELFGRQFAGV